MYHLRGKFSHLLRQIGPLLLGLEKLGPELCDQLVLFVYPALAQERGHFGHLNRGIEVAQLSEGLLHLLSNGLIGPAEVLRLSVVNFVGGPNRPLSEK